MSSNEAPHNRLGEMLEYVTGVVENQKSRLEQMTALAETVKELQGHYGLVELENADLRSQLAEAHARIEQLEADRVQDQRTREALMSSHGRELERMELDYTSNVQEISDRVSSEIAEIREKAQATISSIQGAAQEAVTLAESSARDAVSQAQSETDSMRAAYETVVAENDRLHGGMDALMRAVEETNRTAGREDEMIAMISGALVQRRETLQGPSANDDNGSVLRMPVRPETPAEQPQELNRVA